MNTEQRIKLLLGDMMISLQMQGAKIEELEEKVKKYESEKVASVAPSRE